MNLEVIAPLLRFVSGEKLNLKTINFLFTKLGYVLPIEVIELALDGAQSLMKEKNYSNVAQLVGDEEFKLLLSSITDLLSNSPTTDPQLEGGVEDAFTDLIHIDSVIKCPICRSAFSLRDGAKN
jgi:hypothetical protein